MNISYTRLEPMTLTREIVAEETDTETLYSWLGCQQKAAAELSEFAAAVRISGSCDYRLGRKLGYINVSKLWIIDRLVELGEDKAEIRKTRVQAKQITLLHAKIAELKRGLEA